MIVIRVLMAMVTLYALYKYVRTNVESYVPEGSTNNQDNNDLVRQKISNLPIENEIIKRQELKNKHLYPPNYASRLNNYENKLIDNFCTNEHVISTIQRDMFRNARFELLGVDNKIYQWNTGEFYYHHYGGLDVTLINTVDSTSSKLFYYQIMRNGNTNIQDHLLRFAELYPNYKECHNANYCSRVQKFDRKNIEKDTFSKIYYNKLEVKTDRHHRLPFTFIRDPLERFISGYSEIEYILDNKNINTDPLHLYSELGTPRRFQDFVINLLLSNEPEKWLNSVSIDVHYISPQIGTLLFATIKEYSHIRLYKLEDFDDEYNNLVLESGFKKLKEVYSEAKRQVHASYDPHNTTMMARAFLLLQDDLKNNSSNEHDAKLFTRAICRIYIVDYMCLGYELPSYCNDIDDEVIELLKEDDLFHKKYNIKPFRSLADFLIAVPQTAYYGIVSVFCAITSWTDPSCAHRLYYTDFYSEDEL